MCVCLMSMSVNRRLYFLLANARGGGGGQQAGRWEGASLSFHPPTHPPQVISKH